MSSLKAYSLAPSVRRLCLTTSQSHSSVWIPGTMIESIHPVEMIQRTLHSSMQCLLMPELTLEHPLDNPSLFGPPSPVNKLVPCAWLSIGAFEAWRLRLRDEMKQVLLEHRRQSTFNAAYRQTIVQAYLKCPH